MSISQTVASLSAKFEAARGVVSLLFEHVFLIAKHDEHRVSIGCLDPFQYRFVTSTHWISLFLMFEGGICSAADSMSISAGEDHAR